MAKKIVMTMAAALFALMGNAQVNNETTGVPGDTIDWEKYLDQVTVSAVRPLVKMEADKMTYDVQNDADSKSATVLDMLRKVPMVTVDGQDNITVNGSGSFKVYVDGKPSPMFSNNPSQIFKMMPAAAVSKIEVITNPGAKYDAEGAVGVLNIVLAKMSVGGGGQQSIDGMTGTVRAQGGSQGYNGGASFSVQQGKLSLSGNLMTGYQRMPRIKSTTERREDNGNVTSQYFTTKQKTRFNMGTLSLSYDIDSLNTVSGSFGLTAFRIKNRFSPSISLISPDSRLSSYSYNNDTKQKSTSIDASADWQHFFNGERTHYITLSYLFGYSPQTSETTQHYDEEVLMMDDIFNENRPKSTEHTVQLDYVHPLNATQTLNLGGKYINRRNLSKADYYLLSGDERTLTNQMDYQHTNNIAAAYAEYEGNFGVVSGKAGLRYEHTWQDVEYKKGEGGDFSTDYGNLVPSLSLNLKPSATSNIGLTYNMRISRPGITYLNPYVDRSDPMQVSYGNSHLKVEKNHNIGLSYSLFSSKFMMNIGLVQGLCDNRISSYSFFDEGVLYSTFGNIVKERNTSLNLFINWLALPKTRLMLNGGATYADLRSDQLGQRNHGWQGNLMVGLQQTLPWDLKLSLNMVSNSRSYNLQGWSSGFNIGIASITKSFLKDRLSISAYGVTGLNDHGKLSFETYTRGSDFSNRQKISVPIAQFGVSVSFTFGNTKVRVKQHKSRIENDFTEKKSDQEQIGDAAGSSSGSGM